MSFAICVENLSKECNLGVIMRAAYNFEATAIFVVGRRYVRTGADTPNAQKHIPLIHFKTWEDYAEHTVKWQHVAIEITDNACDIRRFTHPKSAVYVFGPEDGSLSKRALALCSNVVKIPTRQCLNLGVAAAIVMYDRITKNDSVSRKKLLEVCAAV
jgi:tRNA G18 (ribose-2'-O)-methylase SpoU